MGRFIGEHILLIEKGKTNDTQIPFFAWDTSCSIYPIDYLSLVDSSSPIREGISPKFAPNVAMCCQLGGRCVVGER
jgi:hypothetical protein